MSQNEIFRDHLQSEIMPTLLERGVIKSNIHQVIAGDTLLERVEAAMDTVRRKEASPERLCLACLRIDERVPQERKSLSTLGALK